MKRRRRGRRAPGRQRPALWCEGGFATGGRPATVAPECDVGAGAGSNPIGFVAPIGCARIGREPVSRRRRRAPARRRGVPVACRRHRRRAADAVRAAEQRLALQLAPGHRLALLRHLQAVPPRHVRGFALMQRHELLHLALLLDVLLFNMHRRHVRQVLGNHRRRRRRRRAVRPPVVAVVMAVVRGRCALPSWGACRCACAIWCSRCAIGPGAPPVPGGSVQCELAGAAADDAGECCPRRASQRRRRGRRRRRAPPPRAPPPRRPPR